jgi:hypothetical protein
MLSYFALNGFILEEIREIEHSHLKNIGFKLKRGVAAMSYIDAYHSTPFSTPVNSRQTVPLN